MFQYILVFYFFLFFSFSQEIESSLSQQKAKSSGVVISGYGELHYNNVFTEDEKNNQHYLDFHRFVLFFGYDFNEQWSFKSEIEIEHNMIGAKYSGELELEQAFINFKAADFLNLRAGVLLMAAGLINEYHEPPTFLSVERPLYNKYLIPTTWFGNGFAIVGDVALDVEGKMGSVYYHLGMMEGLNGDKISQSSGIRSARGKGESGATKNSNGKKINFKNPLFNTYVDYRTAGLKTGFSHIYNKADGTNATTTDINLLEYHLKFEFAGLYVAGELGTILYSDHYSGVKQSFAGYFDLGYNVFKLLNRSEELTLWGRYSLVNPAFKTKDGGEQEKKNESNIWRFGIRLKPIAEIAIKVDFGQVTKNEKTTTEVNTGVGYYF